MNPPTKLPTNNQLREDVETIKSYLEQLQQNTIKNNFSIALLQTEIQETKKRFRDSGFIYIASPYSHERESVMENRYKQVMWYTLGLLKRRQWCFSPILHCHEIAKQFSLPRDVKYWMNYNFAMLSAARELHVLCLPGWQDSVGVSSEVAFWRNACERPPSFVEADKVSYHEE